MRKALVIWQLIKKSLGQNVPVMLLYVLESKGSSPGRQGFIMAVNAIGEMEGSIGGGIMEHKFLELAKDKLKAKEDTNSVRKQIHDKQAAANQSGMICSGEQTILLYHVKAEDIMSIQQIINCLEQDKNGIIQLSQSGLNFLADNNPGHDYTFSYQSEDDWLYQEKIGYINHLFIIGGGHCALALSKLMKLLNFYIHLFDDRPGLKTFIENDYVHEKTLLNTYKELEAIIPSGENNYVVIMTFGYRTDDITLRALLYKKFKYFGLLGSQKKIEKMFADYRMEGIAPDLLNQIHAPVGLPIHSQTPEEIAVSIAAQIIEVKNKENSIKNNILPISNTIK